MAVRENEKIAKASQEWEYLRGDEAVKRMAFLREKWERDWNSGMHSAEEVGIEKGMKEGEKRGLKKGKEEVAIKMLKKGIEEATIEEVTNLTLEEIENIKEKLKSEVEYEIK